MSCEIPTCWKSLAAEKVAGCGLKIERNVCSTWLTDENMASVAQPWVADFHVALGLEIWQFLFLRQHACLYSAHLCLQLVRNLGCLSSHIDWYMYIFLLHLNVVTASLRVLSVYGCATVTVTIMPMFFEHHCDIISNDQMKSNSLNKASSI